MEEVEVRFTDSTDSNIRRTFSTGPLSFDLLPFSVNPGRRYEVGLGVPIWRVMSENKGVESFEPYVLRVDSRGVQVLVEDLRVWQRGGFTLFQETFG